MLSLGAQAIVIGPVCRFVLVWVCYHDNSKLCASIFTKLGNVCEGSDRLQLIRFWLSCGPGEGGLRWVENFWLRLTTASAQCLCLSECFFIFVYNRRHQGNISVPQSV